MAGNGEYLGDAVTHQPGADDGDLGFAHGATLEFASRTAAQKHSFTLPRQQT
jgi:hypothetical protein